MIRHVDIHVTVDDGIIFQFARPLAIMWMSVFCLTTKETVWELIHDTFGTVDRSGASSSVSADQSCPTDEEFEEALDWSRRTMEQVDREQARRLESEGPHFPTRQSLKFGEVPAGYREDWPAKTLVPGRYSVNLFTEHGNGFTVFDVP